MKLLTVRNTRTSLEHEVIAQDARQAKHIVCSHFPDTVMSELKVTRSINLENQEPRLL